MDMEEKQDSLYYCLPGQILDGSGKVHCRRPIHGRPPGVATATV